MPLKNKTETNQKTFIIPCVPFNVIGTMNKLFIIGLPRTGTTSISVALLNHGFKVAHTAYTKRAFELADVISDAPCFCDYQQLDRIFPGSKFIYLNRSLKKWIPSIQMLLKKMLPELSPKTGYLNPVLKRCISSTFKLTSTNQPLTEEHLTACYLDHQSKIFNYFSERNNFLSIDLSDVNSLKNLMDFLEVYTHGDTSFPHLNIGKQVDCWQKLKHPNKINSLSAGIEHRKFFDYPQ